MAKSRLGGKIISGASENFLFQGYTPKQKKDFQVAREEARKKEFGKAMTNFKIKKRDVKNTEDYPQWQTAQMYKGKSCPVCEGRKVESEHAKTLASVGVPKEKIKEAETKIAEDHIAEDPKYYDKLKAVEKGPVDKGLPEQMSEHFKEHPEDRDKFHGPPPEQKVKKADTNQTDNDATDEKELKNHRLNSKLSPSVHDLKEVQEVLKDDVKKEWYINLEEMLSSTREFDGTFHKPVIDKENDIIPASAMDKAMDDFMVLPMLQEVHTERPVGIITKAWRTSEDEYKFKGKIKPGDDCNDVWDKIKKGEYDGLSIGGRRIRYSKDCSIPSSIRTTPCVTHKLKLYNVSVCSSPVNPEATVDSVSKSLMEEKVVFDITETLSKSAEQISKGENMDENEATEGVSKSDEELITKSDIAELTKAVEDLTKAFASHFGSLTTPHPQSLGGKKARHVTNTLQKGEDEEDEEDEDEKPEKKVKKSLDPVYNEVEDLRKSFDEVITERDDFIRELEGRLSAMEETTIKKGGQAVIIPDQLAEGDPLLKTLSNMDLLTGRMAK